MKSQWGARYKSSYLSTVYRFKNNTVTDVKYFIIGTYVLKFQLPPDHVCVRLKKTRNKKTIVRFYYLNTRWKHILQQPSKLCVLLHHEHITKITFSQRIVKSLTKTLDWGGRGGGQKGAKRVGGSERRQKSVTYIIWMAPNSRVAEYLKNLN